MRTPNKCLFQGIAIMVQFDSLHSSILDLPLGWFCKSSRAVCSAIPGCDLAQLVGKMISRGGGRSGDILNLSESCH